VPWVGVEHQAQGIGAGVGGGDLPVDVLGVTAEGRDRFGAAYEPGADGGQHRIELLLRIHPLPALGNPLHRPVLALPPREARDPQRPLEHRLGHPGLPQGTAELTDDDGVLDRLAVRWTPAGPYDVAVLVGNGSYAGTGSPT
jgi:hypothetical protein